MSELTFFRATRLMERIEAQAAETGELTEEQAAALVEAHAKLPDAVEDLAATILRLGMFVEYLEREQKRIQEARKRVERIKERLEHGAVAYMQKRGLQKLTGGTYLLKPRKCPPRVEVGPELPQEYQVAAEIKHPSELAVQAALAYGGIVTWKPDKPAIKAALQAGQEVPGARLVQDTKLSIT